MKLYIIAVQGPQKSSTKYSELTLWLNLTVCWTSEYLMHSRASNPNISAASYIHGNNRG